MALPGNSVPPLPGNSVPLPGNSVPPIPMIRWVCNSPVCFGIATTSYLDGEGPQANFWRCDRCGTSRYLPWTLTSRLAQG